MNIQNEWFRTSKSKPCLICKKDSWCTFTSDGSWGCMRVESKIPMKNGGWLHKSTDPKAVYIPTPKVKAESTVNFFQLWSDWLKATRPKPLVAFSETLDLNALGLHWLGAVWSPENGAWAFPMYDENRNIIGIRLRNGRGDKWAVKGSKQGIFLNRFFEKHPLTNPIFITEGVTDASAAMELGFSAIGRPSCQGCEEMIVKFLKLNKIKRVVIVSDNDSPGLRGAEKLQGMMRIPSALLIPPAKDLREFLKLGGAQDTINSMLKNTVWTQPKDF